MSLTIAVFHCSAGVGSAWGCAEGISLTLGRLGHRVLDCGRPSYRRFSVAQLNDSNLILLSAPEWYWEEFQLYVVSRGLSRRIPIAAWHAESAHRDDRDFDFHTIRSNVSKAFYPAVQDAQALKGVWLPFGVDHRIFHPCSTPKVHECAFLGTIYPKRQAYLDRINYPIAILPPIDLESTSASFSALADTYRSIRLFVNLPTLSRLLVTKVSEVLACGTFLLTPRIDHPTAAQNETQFRHGEELIYYNPDNPEDLSNTIRWLLHNDSEMERIARNGARKVASSFTLETQLKTLITSTLGIA